MDQPAAARLSLTNIISVLVVEEAPEPIYAQLVRHGGITLTNVACLHIHNDNSVKDRYASIERELRDLTRRELAISLTELDHT